MDEPKSSLKETQPTYPKVKIFNPDTEEFKWNYDINGDRSPVEFVMPPLKISEFVEPVAKHLKKHLAETLVWKRGIKTNYDDEYNKILKEIEVNL